MLHNVSSSHNTTSASCIYALEAYGIKDPAVKNVDTRVLALYGIVEAEFRGVDVLYSIRLNRPRCEEKGESRRIEN